MSDSYVIGIDLGGTNIRAGIFRSSDYKLIKKITVPTAVKGGKKTILSHLEAVIKRLIRKNTVGIGIGLAGIVNREKGIFVGGPHLPTSFANTPIVRLLTKKFGIPVRIENDARCFTLAEALSGAGRGHAAVFGLTLGTGIGGGFFRAGELISGREAAGEIGHLPVADEIPGHPPSKTVDLERAASGKGLEHVYLTLTGKTATAKTIASRDRKGDRAAKKTLDIGRHALMKALSSIQLLFDPDCIIIGGGLGKSTGYWEKAARRVKKMRFPSLKRINVKRSKLGDDAGMLGAALLYEL